MTETIEQARKVMTVNELAEILEQAKKQGLGHRKIRIPIETGRVTMGGTPCADVLAIHAGFDWNSKSMLLEADKPLGVVGEELETLKSTSMRATDTLYRLHSILKDERFTQEVKLKLMGEWLNKFWERIRKD